MAELKTPTGIDARKDAQADAQLDRMVAGEKKKKRRRLALVALLLVAALLWFVVRPMIAAKAGIDSGYRNFAAERRDISVEISGSGVLLPADSYNIIGLVQGDILAADFEEGDYVEKDTLLYQIDSSDAERSIEQAEIALRNADLSYAGIVDNLDGLEPQATVSGRVAKLHVDSGDEVNAGALLAEIRDSDTMKLTVPFHQMQVSSIGVGAMATVTISDTGEQLIGTVTKVSGMAEAGVGGTLVCNVEISVPNPGGITGGMTATASVNGVACAAAGSFANSTSSMVYAGAAGTIGKIYVGEGQRVEKNQALMALDSDAAERQLESAGLSRRASELSLENARDMLENYAIKAPISGTIVEKNYKAGDTLDSTSAMGPMAVIYDMSYLTLTLNIDELYIQDIRVGQKVLLEADAAEGQVFTGVVDRIGINGNVLSGVTTYPVRVIVENYGSLLPGMNVTADIVVEEAKDILTVPVSAVQRGNTVLVADEAAEGDPEKGIPAGYRQVEVEVGRADDEYIEILSGVQEGEMVAVNTNTTSLFETMINASPMGGAVQGQ